MRKFAIYYNNGSVVYGGGEDDEEITLTFSRKWLEAPSDGVSCIAYEDNTVGRQLLQSNEYFYQLPINQHGKGAIGASMKMGAFLRQLSDQGGIVKFGGWTDDENFNDIVRKARNDDFMMQESGKRAPHEEDQAD